MSEKRLYDDLAHLWPLVSPPEEYAEEAALWTGVLRDKLGAGRHEILELGVGGGHRLSHMTGEFQATAVDPAEKMLEFSKLLNPGVEHHVGDMRTFHLSRKFDAVLIHDAVSYMLTEDDLGAAFATAAIHLDPGGVLIVGPDFYRETFKSPQTGHCTHTAGGTELTYFEYTYDPDPADTTIETIMHYFIREGDKLHIERDHHVLGLFPKTAWLRLLEAAGFAVEERGRPWPADSPPPDGSDQADPPDCPGLLVGVMGS
jgi:hypothetical protein